jgi:hypothetical protein
MAAVIIGHARGSGVADVQNRVQSRPLPSLKQVIDNARESVFWAGSYVDAKVSAKIPMSLNAINALSRF